MTDRPATITAPPPIVQTIRAYARAAAVAHRHRAVPLDDRADVAAPPELAQRLERIAREVQRLEQGIERVEMALTELEADQ